MVPDINMFRSRMIGSVLGERNSRLRVRIESDGCSSGKWQKYLAAQVAYFLLSELVGKHVQILSLCHKPGK